MSLLDTASLIVTPNGYKEGKLYSVIPSDGSGDLSVTRATTATRVNSAGLVELVPYNLLSYSETFASPWGALSGASVSANSATAPNGQNTAATFSVSSTAFSGFIQTLGTNAQCISIYAKKGTLDYLWIVNESISAIGASYNLATGAVTYTASGHTATIESVGDGWYLCTISHPTNGWEYMQFGLSNASNSGSSPSGGNAYIWGAQAVEGSTAKDYQKTETRLNIPRLDYSNGTCPSLLVEPQRTNLVFWSNNFSPSKAYNYQNASQSSSTITAPDGLTTTGITSTTSANDFHRFFKSVDASSATYTSSIYAKKGDSRYLGLGVNHNGSATKENIVVFDLQDGVIASNPYGVTATIEDANNGWYRLTHTFTYTGATAVDICVHNAGTGAFTTLNFQVFDSPTAPTTLYIYGLQFELGSYATSYIPTTSASVTRNADVISKTGISSLIGQTEGTLFADAYITGKDSTNGSILFATEKVSSGAIMRILYTFNNALRFDVFDGSSFQCQISAGAYNVGDRVKIAAAYKNNDFVMYVNGTQIGTDTSGTVPATDTANINTSIYGDTNGSFIQAAALWKTRLTNTQLAQLTTI